MSSFSRLGLVADDRFRLHDPGAGHPESPARLDAAISGVRQAVPEDKIVVLNPRMANEDEIGLCHSREYIVTARRDIESGWGALSTGDTSVCAASYDVASLAAGGVISAVDAVIGGKVDAAFCAVRPPGHHAGRNRGMGFCVFNNVAIGARYAQRRHGIGNVLVVDWDIHHGNGTQDIFYDDPTVLYFSVHQWPFYPGTGASGERGEGKGRGTTVNCPLPAGAGRAEVVESFERSLVPAARRFRPEIVLVSAGFDGMGADPIGQWALDSDDFCELTDIVRGIAVESATGRIVSVLEGGYDLAGLADAVGSHCRSLAG